MEKLRMNVQGRVQGVGFRYMTKMVADQLGVTGGIFDFFDKCFHYVFRFNHSNCT